MCRYWFILLNRSVWTYCVLLTTNSLMKHLHALWIWMVQMLFPHECRLFCTANINNTNTSLAMLHSPQRVLGYGGDPMNQTVYKGLNTLWTKRLQRQAQRLLDPRVFKCILVQVNDMLLFQATNCQVQSMSQWPSAERHERAQIPCQTNQIDYIDDSKSRQHLLNNQTCRQEEKHHSLFCTI